MIVLISGKQGAGKTTLAKGIYNRCAVMGLSPHFVKFAEPLYKMHDAVLSVLKDNGFTRDIVKDGPLLQLLGTDWGRKTLGDNIWCDLAVNKVKYIYKLYASDGVLKFYPGPVIIIDDARFENEFDAFPDAYTVRLEADKEVRKARCSMWRENDSHPSETGLDNYAKDMKFKHYVMTDSGVYTEDLARSIVEAIIKPKYA